MATTSTAVTINAAFLMEIKEDNVRLRQLRKELADVFAHDCGTRVPRHQLREMLSEYRDQLATHFALEEAFGYFNGPLSVAPHLSARAEALREQHRDLFLQVCQIADEADDVLRHEPKAAEQKRLARRFQEFDAELEQHEQKENDLIIRAFDEDIGVGD
jgi:iron-sulfur cluster repair protein YtfE (RIC family)